MKSTSIRFAAVLSALVAAAVVPVSRAADAPKPVTLKGEIVDLACYTAHGAKGEAHRQCGQACMKGGQPAGLLTESGEVYLLGADHKDGKPYETAREHASDVVEVTGPVASRSGVKLLTVQAVTVPEAKK